MKKLVPTAIRVSLLLALGLLWGRGVVGQEPDAGQTHVVAVAGVAPAALVLVDWATFDVIRSIEGLANVHGVAISPDGSRAYALSLSQADRAVSVVDVATGEVVRVVELEAPAHHAAMEPSGRRLYVTFSAMGLDPARPRGIAAVDPESGDVAIIETEGTPYYVEVAPDGSFLYATTISPDRVLKIALPTFEVVARGAVTAGRPNHIALAEDGSALFVTLLTGGVAKVDAGTLELLGTADIGPGAHAVALAGEPVRLFVANQGPGTLTVLDPETLEKITQLDIAPVPTHLLPLPGGALLISAAGSRELLKLDPDSLEIVDRLPLQVQPHQTAVARGR